MVTCTKTSVRSNPWVKIYKRVTDKHPAGIKYRSRVCAGQDLQKNPKVIAWRKALKEMHDFKVKGTSGTFTTHRKKKGFSRRDADRKHILKKDIQHMKGKKVARPKLLIPKKGTAAYKKIKARMAVILRDMSAPKKKPEYLYKLAPAAKKKRAAPRKKKTPPKKKASPPKKKASPKKASPVKTGPRRSSRLAARR